MHFNLQSAIQNLQSHLDVRFRIIPLPHFLLKLLALVHDDLAVLVEADAPAFQGARGRALEVDAGDFEAAAVAGAFELLRLGEPVRRAAPVRAGGAERVDEAALPYHPDVAALEAGGALVVRTVVRAAGRTAP